MNPVKMMEKRKTSNLIIVEFPWRKATLHQSACRRMRVTDNLRVRLLDKLSQTVSPHLNIRCSMPYLVIYYNDYTRECMSNLLVFWEDVF